MSGQSVDQRNAMTGQNGQVNHNGQHDHSEDADDQPPRIVAFNVELAAYELVREWAAAAGHTLALVVTTPGPPPRTFPGHREIVAAAPASQDVLITTKFRRAVPIIAAARPDLILSYTFPYRLPDDVLAIAPLGALNLHPSPLPHYRGPNPLRSIYDGAPTIGATLHRMTAGFDAGPIMSRQEAPLPDEPTIMAVRAAFRPLLWDALDDGVRRAIAGDPGEPQDEQAVSYAASFAPEEYWLDWRRDATTLQRQATALNLVLPQARAWIEGEPYDVLSVTPVGDGDAPLGVQGDAEPGTVLDRRDDHELLATGSGFVWVELATRPGARDTPREGVGAVGR